MWLIAPNYIVKKQSKARISILSFRQAQGPKSNDTLQKGPLSLSKGIAVRLY